MPPRCPSCPSASHIFCINHAFSLKSHPTRHKLTQVQGPKRLLRCSRRIRELLTAHTYECYHNFIYPKNLCTLLEGVEPSSSQGLGAPKQTLVLLRVWILREENLELLSSRPSSTTGRWKRVETRTARPAVLRLDTTGMGLGLGLLTDLGWLTWGQPISLMSYVSYTPWDWNTCLH